MRCSDSDSSLYKIGYTRNFFDEDYMDYRSLFLEKISLPKSELMTIKSRMQHAESLAEIIKKLSFEDSYLVSRYVEFLDDIGDYDTYKIPSKSILGKFPELYEAVFTENIEQVRKLSSSHSYETLLRLFYVYSTNPEMKKELIMAGADPNKTLFGNSQLYIRWELPLFRASIMDDIDEITSLIEEAKTENVIYSKMRILPIINQYGSPRIKNFFYKLAYLPPQDDELMNHKQLFHPSADVPSPINQSAVKSTSASNCMFVEVATYLKKRLGASVDFLAMPVKIEDFEKSIDKYRKKIPMIRYVRTPSHILAVAFFPEQMLLEVYDQTNTRKFFFKRDIIVKYLTGRTKCNIQEYDVDTGTGYCQSWVHFYIYHRFIGKNSLNGKPWTLFKLGKALCKMESEDRQKLIVKFNKQIQYAAKHQSLSVTPIIDNLSYQNPQSQQRQQRQQADELARETLKIYKSKNTRTRTQVRSEARSKFLRIQFQICLRYLYTSGRKPMYENITPKNYDMVHVWEKVREQYNQLKMASESETEYEFFFQITNIDVDASYDIATVTIDIKCDPENPDLYRIVRKISFYVNTVEIVDSKGIQKLAYIFFKPQSAMIKSTNPTQGSESDTEFSTYFREDLTNHNQYILDDFISDNDEQRT